MKMLSLPQQKKNNKTTAQDRIQEEIDLINADLVGLYRRRDANVLTAD
jgi:uncharacterized protein YpmB